MTVTVPFLSWMANNQATGLVATQTCNFATSLEYDINTQGSDQNDNTIYPAVCVIDNCTNPGSVNIYINGIENLIVANTRSAFPIPGGAAQIRIVSPVNEYSTYLQFYQYASDAPPDLQNLSSIIQTAVSAAIKPGFMWMWPISVAPAGFYNCDGSAVSIAANPNLFALIGYTFGNPGGGNFTLPDMQDCVPIMMSPGGLSNGRATARTIGSYYGEESHTLVIGEQVAPTITIVDPTHQHGVAFPTAFTDAANLIAGDTWNGTLNELSTFVGTGITATANGGGGAHNNIQPSFGINFIIAGG